MFIVKNDLLLRLLYEKALSLGRYEVIGLAKNGEEAVRIYKNFSEKPDRIIMDH
ncbi:MAG: hypothetical protein ACFFBY_15665 [Promethearchaeota archaeon]